MKKLALCGALAALGAAGSALAVNDNSVQMQLRFVEQLYGGFGGASTGSDFTRSLVANVGSAVPPLPGAANRTRTFELEYSLTAGSGATVPAGLVSCQITILGPAATYSRALLTRSQAQTASISNPTATQPRTLGSTDTSGPTTGSSSSGNPSTGTHEPFRVFSPDRGNNNWIANGTIIGTGFTGIQPLDLTQVLTPPITDQWFGLYSFSVVVPDLFTGDFAVTATILADAQSHNAFGYFNDGVAGQTLSTNVQNATLHIAAVAVPAPGSVGLLALAGLAGARRRRPRA